MSVFTRTDFSSHGDEGATRDVGALGEKQQGALFWSAGQSIQRVSRSHNDLLDLGLCLETDFDIFPLCVFRLLIMV